MARPGGGGANRPPRPQPQPQPCPSAGTTPALDHDGDLAAAPAGAPPAAAAAAVIDAARAAGADLDAALPAAARADVAAWTALAVGALEPASTFTAWCEPAAYAAHTRPAYGGGLPFPLSRLVPRSTRAAALARFAHTTRDAVYDAAAAAHAALAARLAARGGDRGAFFFGEQPSSLDALLFAHLSFHASAPVSSPELRESVARLPGLSRYVDGLSARLALTPPPIPPPYDSPEWAARAEEAAAAARAGGRRPAKKGGGDAKAAVRRGNTLWLAAAGILLVGYVLLSGQYIEFALDDLEYEPDGDGGDEGGDGE